MWKKALIVMIMALTAPLLVNCAASGSASVGDEDPAAGSSAGDADGSTGTSSSDGSTTQQTTTTTTTTQPRY
jgi:hypothetical protein